MKKLALIAAAVLAGLACDVPAGVPGMVVLDSPEDGAVLRSPSVIFSWWSGGHGEWAVEVAEDGDFRKTVVFDTVMVDADQLIAWAVELVSDGDYFWRVRARSTEGAWGPWSDTRGFLVERFTKVASVPTPGYAQSIFVLDDRAYIADGQAGLAVFDVSDPGSPVLLGTLMDSLNEAYGVVAHHGYAFLAYGYKELMAVDVSNPESLRIAGEMEYPQPGNGLDIAYRDSTVYIAADAQFIIADVSDPRYPGLSFQYRYPRGLRGVALQDTFCFLALEQIGVAIWNVSVVPPVQVSSFDTPSNARGVAAANGLLLVADGRDGLMVVDVADPAVPVELARVEMPGYANRVTIAGERAYVGCGSDGLAVVDIADPSAPTLIAVVETSYARGAQESGGYVFACDRDQGLVVIEIKE